MFGRVETTSGEARTNLRAAWPRVRSPDSVRKERLSTFLRPVVSHSFGRWRRWSLGPKVVFSSYLPSSIPEERGTRTAGAGAGVVVGAEGRVLVVLALQHAGGVGDADDEGGVRLAGGLYKVAAWVLLEDVVDHLQAGEVALAHHLYTLVAP